MKNIKRRSQTHEIPIGTLVKQREKYAFRPTSYGNRTKWAGMGERYALRSTKYAKRLISQTKNASSGAVSRRTRISNLRKPNKKSSSEGGRMAANPESLAEELCKKVVIGKITNRTKQG